MKTIYKAMTAILLIGAIACTEEKNEPAYAPTEEDASKIIEESLAQSSGGLTDEIAMLGETTGAKTDGELELTCNVPFDTSFVYTLSGNTSGIWTRNWNLLLNCSSANAPFLEVNTSYTGSFDGIFKSHNNQGSRYWTWSNLGPQGETLFMNGTGAHSGQRSFNVAQENSFSWSQNAEWTDVAISKETLLIESGSGIFTLTLTDTNGIEYTFDGTIIFNGNQMATLTVNGEVYEIELG